MLWRGECEVRVPSSHVLCYGRCSARQSNVESGRNWAGARAFGTARSSAVQMIYTERCVALQRGADGSTYEDKLVQRF